MGFGQVIAARLKSEAERVERARAEFNFSSTDAMLEALHHACPQATFVVLSDDAAGVPSFATRVGRSDAQALKALLAPGENAGAALQPVLEEVPRGIAASGGSR